VLCRAVQMQEMVAKTEQDAIPVSDVVCVVVEAATAPQPKVSQIQTIARCFLTALGDSTWPYPGGQ
jgi:hypothetical protein